VGCGTGRLGEKLKLEKNCYVVGIEVSESSADLARKRLNDVIIADVEKLTELPFPDGYFHVIVFADVLEHLKAPDRVLCFFKRYLNANGYALISIPNVANWTLRLKLMFGRWDYKDRGLLDRSHIKFFTLKTARSMLGSCGFRIVKLLCLSGGSWLDWRAPSRNPANLWKSLLACNFIFKTVKVNE
jgi:SAM-dependent methyltransferase